MSQNDALNMIFAMMKANKHNIFLLCGEVGSGKTTFVKNLGKRAGIGDLITSPTFNLAQQYGSNFYHYDLYRKNLNEMLSLGLLDMLSEAGFHFVEWGDEKLFTMLQAAFECVTCIKIIYKANAEREYFVGENQWIS